MKMANTRLFSNKPNRVVGRFLCGIGISTMLLLVALMLIPRTSVASTRGWIDSPAILELAQAAPAQAGGGLTPTGAGCIAAPPSTWIDPSGPMQGISTTWLGPAQGF